ncbi:DUF262 domain-containing protein [Jiangella gansuensis]|uniref:DUF262 domain-containing protein n=1 Tax=Jiangella gansuensis TaxID=281473 RepID=UPI0004AEA0CE|nr:DUF1524 domain-containing protein [Jiangella gansuensis]
MFNNPRKAKGTDRLKVWPTNANRAAFATVLNPDGLPPDHVDDPGNRIDEAFGYFSQQVELYLDELDSDEIAETRDVLAGVDQDQLPQTVKLRRAERLRITLSDLLKVVSITLETDDNAQVIFETLNARGTPLLALDLVKNAVFHEAAQQRTDTDALYDQVWRPELDDEYWRVKRRQGRLNRPTGELFLMHWLTMRLEHIIPATELFATFRQSVLRPATDPAALVHELTADAAVMRSFDNPRPGTPEAEFFRRMVPLDAGTVMPIVLLLFRSPEVTVERRRRALRILESWLARRALMRLTAKNYNRLVPRLIATMKADLQRADEALFAALSGGEGEISRWPDDDEFFDFLIAREVYGTVAKPRIVMALAAVEASLYTSKTDVLDIPVDRLSIEHLMPQEWEEHWPITGPDGKPLEGEAQDKATEQRRARLHRLGNLTIVTQPLNSALSNAAWLTKRTALNRSSRLLLNARLAERDRWDEASTIRTPSGSRPNSSGSGLALRRRPGISEARRYLAGVHPVASRWARTYSSRSCSYATRRRKLNGSRRGDATV